MSHKTIRIDKRTYDKVLIASNVHNRSLTKQLSHWVNLGRVLEESDEFNVSKVGRALRAEIEFDTLTALESAYFMEKHADSLSEPSKESDEFYAALGREASALGYKE